MFSIILGLSLIGPACAMAQHKPSATIGWKTYEAANGQEIKVNMDSIWHRQGESGVSVLMVGVDVTPEPMYFDCHGHFLHFVTNETGSTMSGWLFAPPRSIAGRIAKDVCAKR
jgi:hypothetical protein